MLDWLIGVAYFDEKLTVRNIWLAPGFNENVSTVPPNGPIPGGPLVFSTDELNANKSYSVFGDLTLRLLGDRLHLTAGGRRFKSEFNDRDQSTGALIGVVGTATPLSVTKGSDTGFVPRFAAKYYVTSDAMLYANVGKGFRAGGPSGLDISIPACLNALRRAGISLSSGFKSDSLINYELGTKWTFADKRVDVDVAAFYVDWKDLQSSVSLNVFDPGCPAAVVANEGSASSKGAEMSVIARPLDALLLNASVTYTDAKLGKPPVGTMIGNEGDPLQNAPVWQATAGAEYKFPMVHGTYNGFLRVDTSYYGWQISNQTIAHDPFVYVPARALLNLRLGFGPPNREWAVETFINNALNREQIYGANVDFGEPKTNQVIVGRPRQFGVLIRTRW